MRKVLTMVAGFMALVLMFGANNASAEESNNAGKILIAYYSYSGNTQKVAEEIHEKIGGDLFRIETEESYPQDYNELLHQAKMELANRYHPKLKAKVKNINEYDVVFIGSPNWWGNITAPVSSFMAETDLRGKKVIPFITHGKGGTQYTIKGMQKQCTECNFEERGWSGFGGRTWGISGWLNEIGFKN